MDIPMGEDVAATTPAGVGLKVTGGAVDLRGVVL